jgi:hypothetical protein
VAQVMSVVGVAVAVDVSAIGPDGLIATKMVGEEIAIVHADRISAQAASANGSAGVPEPQWAGSPAG